MRIFRPYGEGAFRDTGHFVACQGKFTCSVMSAVYVMVGANRWNLQVGFMAGVGGVTRNIIPSVVTSSTTAQLLGFKGFPKMCPLN